MLVEACDISWTNGPDVVHTHTHTHTETNAKLLSTVTKVQPQAPPDMEKTHDFSDVLCLSHVLYKHALAQAFATISAAELKLNGLLTGSAGLSTESTQ